MTQHKRQLRRGNRKDPMYTSVSLKINSLPAISKYKKTKPRFSLKNRRTFPMAHYFFKYIFM